MEKKIYTVYWIIDTAKQNNLMTDGYVGITTQTARKRFNGHKKNARSGVDGSSSNTKRTMKTFIENCEKPDVIELCKTEFEDIALMIERICRPRAGIGANRHKGGKKNGVQRTIICHKPDGTTQEYPSISQSVKDGFQLGGVADVLKERSSYTSHPTYGKCVFTYKD